MRADVKQLWLEALRSGEYPQTTGTLRDGVGFCCLGVVCDVAVKQGVIPEPIRNSAGWHYGARKKSTHLLPPAVRRWAGLDETATRKKIKVPDPEELGYESEEYAEALRQSALTCLNDNGATFEDIAKIIEEEF